MTLATATHVELTDLGEGLGYLRLSTPELERGMQQSLSRHGQLTPILAYRRTGGYEVVDGFKRLRSARALGWRHLRIDAFEQAEGVNAKLLVWQSNQGHELTELEEAWVVRALYREDGLTQPRIAQLVGRHKSWVSRRLMLAEGLEEEVQAQVRLGLLGATAAREVARLPRGNQVEAAQVITRCGLTTRQSARLVEDVLAATDEAGRRRVLEFAAQATPVHLVPESRTRRRTPGEWLVYDVAAATRICTRLTARLLERPLLSLGTGVVEVAADGLRTLSPGLLGLSRAIERQLSRMSESGGDSQ